MSKWLDGWKAAGRRLYDDPRFNAFVTTTFYGGLLLGCFALAFAVGRSAWRVVFGR